MNRTKEPQRSQMQKRRNARLRALFFVAVTTAALAVTISTGSCAGETRRKPRPGMTLLTGDDYSRDVPSTCGMARAVLPGSFDVIPCQFCNLMPLTLVGAFAGWWLLLDLASFGRGD